jgi:phosphoglycerol transferase MdoB-like AlkP superfamily enzyme
MNEISIPYHLIIPSIISILILGIIFFKRKQIFKNRKWKWFWISLTIFFLFYLLIVGGATYGDVSSKLTLQKFDLNGDGNFSLNEITTEQKTAMRNVISDIGRNFSFITGLIFSGIIAIFVFIIGKISEYLKERKTTHNNL